MKYATAAGLLLCAILGSSAASAQSVLGAIPTLESISSRLELTPEQEARLRPIFENRQLELQQSALELRQASSKQQKRDVLQAAKSAGTEFNSQVESALTPSQKNEWRQIRSEVREKAKDRIEEDRPSQ